MSEMINNTLFVAGTDTSVGKTYVCAGLLAFLQQKGIDAGYQKWVATGVNGGLPEDLVNCLTATGCVPTVEHVDQHIPYCFQFPASPHLAAEMEATAVDPERIVARYKTAAAQYEWLIVEGVGGIMVPLRRDLLLIDLLEHLKPRVLVVARSGLGTLNHTLLTLEALRTRHIPILGVVFSDSAPVEDESIAQDNMQTIEEIGLVRVFGRLPRQQNQQNGAGAFMPVGQAIWEQLCQAI